MGMFDKAFEIAVVFAAVDHLTAPMERMAGQMGMLDKKTQETQKHLNEFKNTAFVGGAITAIGAAGFYALDKLANKAAEVQQQMIQLGAVYNLNIDSSQLKELEDMAGDLSLQTLFSKKQIISVEVELAHAGLTEDAMKSVLPEATYLAEIEKGMGKSESPESSAYNFARMVDDMGIAQSTERMQAFADELARLESVTHLTGTTIGEAFKYAAPQARQEGWSEQDLGMAFGLAARSGMEGSMAGTNLTRMLGNMNSEKFKYMPMGGKTKMKEMGELGFMGDNGRDVFHYFDQEAGQYKLKSFEDITEIMTKARTDFLAKTGGDTEKWAAMTKSLFGEEGGRFAAILDEGNLERLKTQMAQTKSLHEQIQTIRDSFLGQSHILGSNIENLGLAIGKPMMEMLLPAVKAVSDALTTFIGYLGQHPLIAKWIAGVTLFATALALIAGPILLFAGAIGYLRTAQTISVGLRMMGSAFSTMIGPVRALTTLFTTNPILLAITLIIGACYLLYKAWTENWGGMRDYVMGWVNWFEGVYNKIKGWLSSLFDSITRMATQQISIPGGGSFNYNISQHYAGGTDYATGGLALVGENGPEVVNLPRGSQVIPNNRIGGGNVSIASGAIAIYQQPGQSANELAREVMREMGKLARNQSYCRGDAVSPAW